MSKEAMKLALDALEDALNKPMWNRPKMTTAITALREALAEQPAQQEPVAEIREDTKGGGYVHWLSEDYFVSGTKLYTSSPAQRTWVSLTDEEIAKLDLSAVTVKDATSDVRAIEAKLREKNL